jgi:small subunit ribosomal protein S19
MSRSIWKLPFSEISSLPLLRQAKQKVELKLKVWSRRSMVLPHFVGKNFLIYNGKIFVPLKVSEEMIGHKFGEFATTRKKPVHKLNKKKQLNKR